MFPSSVSEPPDEANSLVTTTPTVLRGQGRPIQAGGIWAVRMQAEGAGIMAGLRSGDGPLSVRVRPSSIKHDCAQRATSTGGEYLVNVHAKSCLIPEPLRTLRSEDKGQAGACPDRGTRAIPCTVRAVTGPFP